jgi:hypothetical protein
MSLTPHHAKYFAHDLTRRATSGMDRLSMALFDAAVDLNPHQIEAALFALQSPLSKGVLLADEVGLGKTIEAGIVLCQLWAERKRRLLASPNLEDQNEAKQLQQNRLVLNWYPKIQFHETIKDIEQRLDDPAVRLQSFIVSNTPSATMRMLWRTDKSEMRKRHVLFQEEDKDSYVRSMLEGTGAAGAA